MAGRLARDQRGLDHVGRARHGAREERPRARHHAVALVLRVGGVRELLPERVVRVVERAHQRRVERDVHRLEPVAVLPRVERERERLVVVEVGRPSTWRTALATLSGARAPSRRAASLAAERLVEALERAASPTPARRARASTVSSTASGGSPTASKKAGSTRSTSATMSSTTRRASDGASHAAAMRRRRCSVRPETV